MQSASFLGSNAFRAIVITLFVVAVALVVVLPLIDGGGGGGDGVKITMWSSGEKMTYLKDAVEQYNKEDHRLANGKDIHVTVVQVNSGPMSDHLIARIRDGIGFPDNAPEPHIISPSVDSWLTRVNYRTSTETFDLANTKALALSPVVIAMYEEMAQCLGWPQTELGWADIIALAQSPEGWAAYPCARAEWGRKPLLAWTDPSVSSTARSALFATYSAASGKPADELTAADVQNPDVEQYVRSLQSAVDHYFPETLKLQAKLFDGPKFVQFVPLEEYNLVWLKDGLISDGSTTRPLERRMVAIYPKEGTFWHRTSNGRTRTGKRPPRTSSTTCWNLSSKRRRWRRDSGRRTPMCRPVRSSAPTMASTLRNRGTCSAPSSRRWRKRSSMAGRT
jgi:Ca-activated chloride channel family protein